MKEKEDFGKSRKNLKARKLRKNLKTEENSRRFRKLMSRANLNLKKSNKTTSRKKNLKRIWRNKEDSEITTTGKKGKTKETSRKIQKRQLEEPENSFSKLNSLLKKKHFKCDRRILIKIFISYGFWKAQNIVKQIN